MALTITNRGTANGIQGTDAGVVPSGNFAAGSLAVLCVAYDNAGSSGADPAPTNPGVVDTKGNTWTNRQIQLQDPGVASDGLVLRILTSPQDVGTLTTGDSLDLSGSTTGTPAFAMALFEVVGSVVSPTYVTGNKTSGSGTSATITSTTITNGNAVIGATGVEDENAVTADSDTGSGTWGTAQTSVNSTNGTNTGSIRITAQGKVVNADATQTYNTSWAGSTDYAIAWIEITEVLPAEVMDPLGAMGFFGI